ncbi:hypothetical protein TIFTF001_010937 [Ficus carica]|uniref:Uncharacterized protein n=1 Tax=Ficus carica TaxID=3494 RepID=A0AA87ZZ09_FICCA|nr:hypothetical protein TIFTF001_010937 [Ficus carica]
MILRAANEGLQGFGREGISRKRGQRQFRNDDGAWRLGYDWLQRQILAMGAKDIVEEDMRVEKNCYPVHG